MSDNEGSGMGLEGNSGQRWQEVARWEVVNLASAGLEKRRRGRVSRRERNMRTVAGSHGQIWGRRRSSQGSCPLGERERKKRNMPHR